MDINRAARLLAAATDYPVEFWEEAIHDRLREAAIQDFKLPPEPEITLTDAKRKYGIPLPTVSYWIKTGKVRRLRNLGPGIGTWVSEADVAAEYRLWLKRRGNRGAKARAA